MVDLLRKGLQDMFMGWWNGKDFSPYKRRLYYELKRDYRMARIKKLKAQIEKVGDEASHYCYQEMNRSSDL